MDKIKKYYLLLKEKEQVMLDAESALMSAEHQYDNVARLLAVAVCPFSDGEIILLPYHMGERWLRKGRVISIYPPRAAYLRLLYELKVVVLKKNGQDSKVIVRVDGEKELELRNNKTPSPSLQELREQEEEAHENSTR